MLVTLFRMIMLNRELQSLNAPSPILVTLSGMTMLDKEPHPANASLPMLVTLSGMSMLDREPHWQYLLLVDYQYYTL